MTTTVSAYALSAPEIGNKFEEDGCDVLPLPSIVDFACRLRGVVYRNGKVQRKSKCLSLFTLYFGFFGSQSLYFWSNILLGSPVWLASVYPAALLIFGRSSFGFVTALDSKRWRQMMRNNKYGVIEKMGRSSKKLTLLFTNVLFGVPSLVTILYWLATRSAFTPQVSMVLMVLIIIMWLICMVFETARLIIARAVQGALQMNEAKYMVRDYFALVRRELLKEEPSLYLLAKEQQDINSFCHDVNGIFQGPSQVFVFFQLSQMIVCGLGSVVKLTNYPVEPIFGELTFRAWSLYGAAHAVYFASKNLKVCSIFDATARREMKELNNLRYVRGWAKLGIGGSMTFFEWLKNGHRIHFEILGIPVTAENVSRFSSALLSGFGVFLATAIRSYMDM